MSTYDKPPQPIKAITLLDLIPRLLFWLQLEKSITLIGQC